MYGLITVLDVGLACWSKVNISRMQYIVFSVSLGHLSAFRDDLSLRNMGVNYSW